MTAKTPLAGNTRARLDEINASVPVEWRRLLKPYGVRIPQVLEYLPEDDTALDPLCRARIAYAVHHEMARRLADFLFVSTYLGYEERWTPEGLLPFAVEMGTHLNWGAQRIQDEIELVLRIAHLPEAPR
jgi:glycerol-3-phosphate dehydrogenase